MDTQQHPTQAEEFRHKAAQARVAAMAAEEKGWPFTAARFRNEALTFEHRAKHAEDIASLSKLGEVRS